MFRLKSENYICKKYEVDMWTSAFLRFRVTKLNVLLAKRVAMRKPAAPTRSLRIDVAIPKMQKKKQSTFGIILETRKKLSIFQGGLSKKAYRSTNRLAERMEGGFAGNMIYLIESRLAVVLYRMGMARTVLESIQLIFSGLALVDKRVITNPNFFVPVGSVVEINFPLKNSKHEEFVKKLKTRSVFLLQLPYHEVNTSISAGLFIKRPSFSEVPFPFRVTEEFFFSEFAGRY